MPASAYTGKELAVDGYFGRHSTMVLQTFLYTEGFLDKASGWDHFDDGRFGPKTKKAMQAFLTARGYDIGTAKGWCGWPRQSIKALQMFLKDQGADPGPVDGCWGRRTTRALQTVLKTVGATVDEKAVIATASTDKAPLVAAGMPLLEGVPAKAADAVAGAA